MHEKEVLVFREYIGKQLLQRHKAIGLRYAREHRFPELIGPRSYGIIFKDNDEGQLVFRLSYDSKPLYDNMGRNVPGRSIKTITDAYRIGTGGYSKGLAEAERISRKYLEMAVEKDTASKNRIMRLLH